MGLKEATARFPKQLQQNLESAYLTAPTMVDQLMQRNEMDASVALMAGLSLDPVSREMLEDGLQEFAGVDGLLPDRVEEVIVGGGAHASIYAAVRKQLGKPEPLVLEQRERFGGVLSIANRASFFLNSRNRPGPLGAPGSRDALNVIPGAPMQPSDIGGSEYQTNADLSLVVRCTLALNARIRQAQVVKIIPDGDGFDVETDRGFVKADRVIVATGLSRERKLFGIETDGERLLSYRDLMQRFGEQMFPLRGLGRVAVIGQGDGARTAVEALAGFGPSFGGSVASLDYVRQIDWYGAGAANKAEFEGCNRNRYKRLGSLFPNGANSNPRVRPLPNATTLTKLYDCVQVNGQIYDTVVVCIGYEVGWREAINASVAEDEFANTQWLFSDQSNPDARTRLGQANQDRSLVIVGPAAEIPFETGEVSAIPENVVGLFRLAPRTAAAAALLA